MTVYMVMYLPKIPNIHRIHMVMANSTYFACYEHNREANCRKEKRQANLGCDACQSLCFFKASVKNRVIPRVSVCLARHSAAGRSPQIFNCKE